MAVNEQLDLQQVSHALSIACTDLGVDVVDRVDDPVRISYSQSARSGWSGRANVPESSSAAESLPNSSIRASTSTQGAMLA